MFYGAIMIFGMLAFYAIVVVQWLHPVNAEIKYQGCERCSRGFATVFGCALTLYQQIVTGDSWGQISVPVMEASPLFGFALPIIQLSIGVGAMNLVLAVIVDRAMEKNEQDKDTRLQEETLAKQKRCLEVLTICRDMDEDASGSLSKEEILKASKENKKFSRMLAYAGITDDELEELVTDLDEEGGISYWILCDALEQIATGDLRKNVVLTRMQISRMCTEISTQFTEMTKLLEGGFNASEQLLKTNSEQLHHNYQRRSGDLGKECRETSFISSDGSFQRVEKQLDAWEYSTLSIVEAKIAALCEQIASHELLQHVDASEYSRLQTIGTEFVNALSRVVTVASKEHSRTSRDHSSDHDLKPDEEDFKLMLPPAGVSSPRSPRSLESIRHSCHSRFSPAVAVDIPDLEPSDLPDFMVLTPKDNSVETDSHEQEVEYRSTGCDSTGTGEIRSVRFSESTERMSDLMQ
jgi:hypothetical protein